MGSCILIINIITYIIYTRIAILYASPGDGAQDATGMRPHSFTGATAVGSVEQSNDKIYGLNYVKPNTLHTAHIQDLLFRPPIP